MKPIAYLLQDLSRKRYCALIVQEDQDCIELNFYLHFYRRHYLIHNLHKHLNKQRFYLQQLALYQFRM